MGPEQVAGEVAKYCRELETYLCQKNEGHLIRIVGPAFEQVCSWAERGVPLKIAFRGIDRYCERYYAKPGRRRPIRIEFCEADILDAFDEWRRAVGIRISQDTEGDGATSSRKPSLVAHIERAIARLATLSVRGAGSPGFLSTVDSTIRQLESLAADARGARGDARQRMIERLALVDRELVTAAAHEINSTRSAELMKEAEGELAPFGSRLTAEAREKAMAAAYERLLREILSLPTLSYE
jgi:hypothetical protein